MTIIGSSFTANIIPIVEGFGYEGAFVHKPITSLWGYLGYYIGLSGHDEFFDGIFTWQVNTTGRITNIAPIGGEAPTPNLKGGKFLKGLGSVGEGFHKTTKGGKPLKK